MEQIEPMKPISSESLSKKVVRGGMWVFGLRIINRGLGFIRTIILARLLGIAMLAISTLETFSQTGFQTALIQKKENVESYLDTAWTVSAIRGVILFLILLLSTSRHSIFWSKATVLPFFSPTRSARSRVTVFNIIGCFWGILVAFILTPYIYSPYSLTPYSLTPYSLNNLSSYCPIQIKKTLT